jgi:hypothetical protein
LTKIGAAQHLLRGSVVLDHMGLHSQSIHLLDANGKILRYVSVKSKDPGPEPSVSDVLNVNEICLVGEVGFSSTQKANMPSLLTTTRPLTTLLFRVPFVLPKDHSTNNSNNNQRYTKAY